MIQELTDESRVIPNSISSSLQPLRSGRNTSSTVQNINFIIYGSASQTLAFRGTHYKKSHCIKSNTWTRTTELSVEREFFDVSPVKQLIIYSSKRIWMQTKGSVLHISGSLHVNKWFSKS